jgi:uncharacterized protein YdaU (DUF1376 family)
MNFYPRHLGDYARDAGYLSMTEHGAYTLLLDWYYANEKAIPKELIYSICKASSRQEKNAADRVLRAFFQWDIEQGWTHKRVEAELAKMREKQSKAKESARARWDANAMRTHSERNANAMLSNNQYPISNNQDPLPKIQSNVVPVQNRRGKGLRLIGDILGQEKIDGR